MAKQPDSWEALPAELAAPGASACQRLRWSGEPGTGARDVNEYFRRSGWASDWYCGENWHCVQASDAATGRKMEVRFKWRLRNRFLARLFPVRGCRVRLTATGTPTEQGDLFQLVRGVLNGAV